MYRSGNRFKHPIQVLINILVSESQEADAERLDILLPLGIILLCFLSEMAIPIEFDRQFDLRAIEVDAVRADAILATELLSEQLLSA